MNKGKKMRKRNILWFLSMILLMIGLGGCDSAKPVVDINPTLQESEVPSAEPSLLEQLEKKAEKGDGDALATLGYLYYTGENVRSVQRAYPTVCGRYTEKTGYGVSGHACAAQAGCVDGAGGGCGGI